MGEEGGVAAAVRQWGVRRVFSGLRACLSDPEN